MQLPPIELDFLLSQDKLSFAGEPPRDARSELSPAESQRLLFLVRNELQSQAYLVSAVGSLVNRLAAGTDKDAEILLAYLPPEAHSTIALLDKLIGSSLPAAVLGDLQEVVSRLESARTMTKAFCREHKHQTVRGGVHIEVLAGAWQDLAECAAALLRTLAGHASGGDGGTRSEQVSRVIAMLIEVANGRSPCVRADRSVEIPGWAERRREPRWVVDWPVRMTAPGGFAPARVLNVSQSGTASDRRAAAPSGDRVHRGGPRPASAGSGHVVEGQPARHPPVHEPCRGGPPDRRGEDGPSTAYLMSLHHTRRARSRDFR